MSPSRPCILCLSHSNDKCLARGGRPFDSLSLFAYVNDVRGYSFFELFLTLPLRARVNPHYSYISLFLSRTLVCSRRQGTKYDSARVTLALNLADYALALSLSLSYSHTHTHTYTHTHKAAPAYHRPKPSPNPSSPLSPPALNPRSLSSTFYHGTYLGTVQTAEALDRPRQHGGHLGVSTSLRCVSGLWCVPPRSALLCTVLTRSSRRRETLCCCCQQGDIARARGAGYMRHRRDRRDTRELYVANRIITAERGFRKSGPVRGGLLV